MIPQVRFGEREDVALWKVEGHLDQAGVEALGKQIAALIDMTIVGSRSDTLPAYNGKGGVGIQAYWIWTESWLIIGTWPQLGFIRVYLASCKEFLPVKVSKFLAARVGPVLKFDYVPI